MNIKCINLIILLKNCKNIELQIPLLGGGCRQADGVEGFNYVYHQINQKS